MRKLTWILLVLLCPALSAQSPPSLDYTLSTVAGSFDPADGPTALSTGLFRPQNVAVDSSGNVYIADTSNQRIRKVSPDGSIRTIAGNGFSDYKGDGGPATSASLYSPTAMVLDSSGNLFFADRDNSRIRRVSPDGTIRTVAGNGVSKFDGDGGSATAASIQHPTGIAFDANGTLYIADRDNNRIRAVSPEGVIRTVAGDGTRGYSGDASAATSAALNAPMSVAVDSTGNLYIADTGNHRIRVVSATGTIRTIAGDGNARFAGDNGPATSASLSRPHGLAFDRNGNLFFADRDNLRIRRISTDGNIRTVAGSGRYGFSGDGEAATAARLSSSYGVAVDSNGNLYIADTLNSRIRRVGSDGIIRTFAGNGSVGYGGDGGAGTAAALYFPAGVAVDGSGAVYIGDTGNSRIRKVTPDGIIQTIAGNGDEGFSGDGGPATDASLTEPQGLAVDSAGNLFIADTTNNRVRRVASNGTITTVAGTGASGFSGDDGPATSARLDTPTSVAVDANGVLYIADTGNHRIRRVSRDGLIQTIAGTGRAAFGGDAAAATGASLNVPSGLALSANGLLFIADSGNHRIRRISPDGMIRTVAGNGQDDYSGDGGNALSAALSYPQGVAVDAAGNLFIGDSNSNRIRKVSADGIMSTVAGTANSGYNGDGNATSSSLWYPQALAVDRSGNVYFADTFNNRVRKLSQGVTCPYIVTPAAVTATAAGGPGVITITAPSGCTWTAISNAPFVTITSAAIGTGSGTVNYSVAANTSTSPRTGTLTIASQTVVINQAGYIPPITVAPSSLSFSVAAGSPAQTQTILVDTKGYVTPFTVAVSSAPWLKATPAVAFTSAVLAVTVDPAGLAANTYTATITLSSESASNSPRIPVTLTIAAPPRPTLTLTPLLFSFDYETGGEVPAPASFTVHSSGAPFNFSAVTSTNDGANWLRLAASSGVTPSTLDISVNPSGLSAGTYTGRITVSAPAAGNSPQSIPVTLTVTSPAVTSNLLVSPQAGLEFTFQTGGAGPAVQNLFIASSGDAITFTAAANSSSRWLSVQPAQGTTNAVLAVAVDPSGLSAGQYEGSVTVTGGGQTVTVPVRFAVTQPAPPALQTDTTRVIWSTPAGVAPPPSPVRVINAGASPVTFNVLASTDDSAGWLTASRTEASADAQHPATIVITADPSSLGPGVYSGKVEISAPPQAPIIIPVALAVSAGKKLVLSQQSMSFTAAAGRPSSALPQDLSVLSLGGAISWTASVTAGANWLSLSQSSGSVSAGSLNRVQVNINSQSLAPGEYHGEIVFDSPDVDNRPEKVTVVLVVRSANVLPPAALPAGLAFTAAAGNSPASRDVTVLYGAASANTRWSASVSLDPDSPGGTPLWLRLDRSSGTFNDLAGSATSLTLRPSTSGLRPGVPYRATVFLTISGNVPLSIPVLLVLAPGDASPAKPSLSRKAACTPTGYHPIYTTVDQNFIVAAGQSAALELVILDDCGNPVSAGAVGGVVSNGDRPFDLVSLGDGAWRATYVPRRANGLVTLSVVATDGQSVESAAPPVHGIVTGSINGPVLDAGRPFLAPDGQQQLAIAPGTVFRIQGSNFTSNAGPTRVFLGASELTLQFVSHNHIIAVAPEDLATDRALPLVVQVGEALSAPESVPIAARH
ncbi:MAG: hypothetical protein HY820_42475 [Acidobacteria bacterium]|nr:hypothetical protein [Acidobacteriota bacterium]